jgi:hypothetical protein
MEIEEIEGPFVEDYDNLMYDMGHTVQGVGRMMQSKLGLNQEDHDDLIAALLNAARGILICKGLEYPDVEPSTIGEMIERMFPEDSE